MKWQQIRCIEEIERIFKKRLARGYVECLPAKLFEHMRFGEDSKTKFSSNTITQAKLELGIVSRFLDGAWWWYLPPSMRKPGRQKEIFSQRSNHTKDKLSVNKRKKSTRALDWLTGIMRAHHFDISAKDLFQLRSLEKSGNRMIGMRTLISAKQSLGIVSVKTLDGWHWLWFHDEFEKWIYANIPAAEVRKEDVLKLAKKHGYSTLLVDEYLNRSKEVFECRYNRDDHKFYYHQVVDEDTISENLSSEVSGEANDAR